MCKENEKLRKSEDPYSNLPSSWFGFGDLPVNWSVLIDDICEVVITRHEDQGFGAMYTFDEWNDKILKERLSNITKGKKK